MKTRILGGPFKGARVLLNLSDSKRKLLGVYEHILNDWIRTSCPGKSFAIDVGANDGYHTYGFAHLLSRANRTSANILAFEPDASMFPGLTCPRNWSCYSNTSVQIIQKYAGSTNNDTMATLDQTYSDFSMCHDQSGIIKIDVEGAEVEVMKGAKSVITRKEISWLIEIHGRNLIPEIAEFFITAKRPFLVKELSPLPLIGAEKRDVDTYWLVTI